MLEAIEQEDLINRANVIGEQFHAHLTALQQQHANVICSVRNQGAMIALELMTDHDSENPNIELTKKLIAHAASHGLILLSCGFYSNVIRFLPALTITDEILQEGLSAFTRLFNEMVNDN